MVSEQPTRKVVRELRRAGFVPVRSRGSHTVYEKNSVTITIPDGHPVISPGVYRQVLKKIKEARG